MILFAIQFVFSCEKKNIVVIVAIAAAGRQASEREREAKKLKRWQCLVHVFLI
jgi:hypothetical protein